ncbi:hypothetical protein LSTR_LSTR009079 [Laodelphax striatellus]|uniref:NADP-dependent oxidoreductase domain-containing protein n=1 Tax=Laodelphax striatellus TaxID=195883 RepID=A0A482XNP2_LAOST|nr:hypothetical protein LSTR_LSTR009079 [Laodelphax striatellus]
MGSKVPFVKFNNGHQFPIIGLGTWKEEAGLFPQDKDGKTLYSDVDYVDTWKALEECVKEGLTRSIGLSNFNSQQIDRILAVAEIKPVVECHPYLNQKKLKEFCESKGILLTAYSPLGSPDRPWAKPGDPQLMDDPKLKNLSEKYQKTIAQILIRYQVQRGIIVIPKSVTKSRIESNFDVFDFELSAEDMSYIDGFDCNGRVLHLDWLKDHKHFPFNIEF